MLIVLEREEEMWKWKFVIEMCCKQIQTGIAENLKKLNLLSIDPVPTLF